ncbi:MAG TPA: hypothetical protein VFT65_18425 [Candidatus Angelobacter sp.]|nr:hypothetical protein [Candidatus Angelobacter sp.]
MDDDQKWLEAAAGIQEDIHYLEMALGAYRKKASPSGIEKDIQRLKAALSIYYKNAAAGVPWPSPDHIYCIDALPFGPVQGSIRMRRDLQTAAQNTAS